MVLGTRNRNALLMLSQIANDLPVEDFRIKSMDMKDVRDNAGEVYLTPENPKHGQITMRYFALEGEIVILADK